MPELTTLYRATEEEERGIYPYSCWSEDRDTAEAYTEAGVGHGGAHIRVIDVNLSNTLDITAQNYRNDFEALAEALGDTEPEVTARTWRENGWLYPWEESGSVRAKLQSSGYEWLRYYDDYPEGAVTVMRVGEAMTASKRRIAKHQVSC